MKTTITSLTLVALALVAGSASAQSSFTPGPPAQSPPVAYRHASTLEEGIGRGGADFFRGVGEATYNTSLAMINGQEAYSRYLDNRLKATATYFDMRKLNREARAEERGQRPTQEDLIRYAKMRNPERLAAFNFDAARNAIVWPAVFQHEYFAEEREAIDRLMAERGGAGPESREVQLLAAQMVEKLRLVVHNVQPGEYAAAKKFLVSLQFEMNFAPGATGIAAR
jgi:hypothetical protein